MQNRRDNDYVEVLLGKYDLFFKKSYQIIYNINDFLIALWFLIGSILFFYESLKNIGIWLFVIASVQYSIRPLIRIIHSIHLKRYIQQKDRDHRA
ncbi:YrhK family protein [Aquibacillus koreensis]|uniref:YrhK family protein n=1 Tax=Aquibacillus koreensis TaxID=279446 RepID=A0A9X3WKB3_9BACI|nr:YrhK family protein [Aquibacillus koreensis]MCT2535754.1 YrhK family protein [Aquibacillus koreensis]MDC3420210.1 YrhK family protein [Aquibacillus koreensis]